MLTLLEIAITMLGALLLGAGLLHLLPLLGLSAITDRLARAPGLDLLILYFTVAPLVLGPVLGANLLPWGPWLGALGGLLAGVAAQVLTVVCWTIAHELAHRDAVKGPRIVKELNKTVGPLRNHAAVWTTALATPVFALIRLAELVVYPPLTVLVRLPKYNHAEWVNVSRHKFDGLVGHDLIWCLYCDWMTGVWSLASEMLRNVESFWCPIRFRSDKKCENCKIDFPDVNDGWADASGHMDEVASIVRARYPGPDGANPWFGHPVRMTIDGRAQTDPAAPSE